MIGSLTPAEIEDVLRQQVLGRLGCIVDGRPYVVPVRYAYDAEFSDVYAHSSEGTKLRGMRANPDVCFEVEEIHDMANWRTVIARARFEEAWDDPDEHAMTLLVARLKALHGSEAVRLPRGEDAQERSAPRPVLYRLRLFEKSGRFERP
jgi:nitroimidazol reductase NimA-like FMN-containing flavoprotein (pyridoxamine 5'-phosphate oxidase superfamily)